MAQQMRDFRHESIGLPGLFVHPATPGCARKRRRVGSLMVPCRAGQRYQQPREGNDGQFAQSRRPRAGDGKIRPSVGASDVIDEGYDRRVQTGAFVGAADQVHLVLARLMEHFEGDSMVRQTAQQSRRLAIEKGRALRIRQ